MWQTHYANQVAWKRAACAAFVAATEYLAPFRGHRVEVTFRVQLVNDTQADSDNFIGGPSLKGAQDGIAASLALVPKDTAEWLKPDCVFWNGGPTGDRVMVKIAATDAPRDGSACSAT